MADIAASVLARLKNKAKESGRSYQLCLQLFCQEEFLRRLEKSKYTENLVLKGGLFLYSLTGFDSRVTVDVDFLLRQIPNTPEQLKNILEEIIAVQTGNDMIDDANCITPVSSSRNPSNDNEGTHSAISSSDNFPIFIILFAVSLSLSCSVRAASFRNAAFSRLNSGGREMPGLSLFPIIDLMGQLYILYMEYGVFPGFYLLLIILEGAQCIFAENEDHRHVDDGHAAHRDIGDIP